MVSRLEVANPVCSVGYAHGGLGTQYGRVTVAENWFEALSDEMANGVSATDAVGAVLGGPAGMATLGASAAARLAGEGNGGSWSFDKDEIDAVIAD